MVAFVEKYCSWVEGICKRHSANTKQQQHKLYLYDYNYVVTVLQKQTNKQTNKS